MKVTLSLRAEADINATASYIAADSPQAAARVGAALYGACVDLADFPERFALATELNRPGVRRCPVGEHLIFYVIRADDVFVLRVVHGRRDYAKLFGD